MLREKIKRNEDRVDIARLDASHNLSPKVSGGYIVKCDKYDPGDIILADGQDGLVDPDYLETTPYGISVTGAGKPILEEPDSQKVTQPQIDWISFRAITNVFNYIFPGFNIFFIDNKNFIPGAQASQVSGSVFRNFTYNRFVDILI